jgi:hypothetical protein
MVLATTGITAFYGEYWQDLNVYAKALGATVTNYASAKSWATILFGWFLVEVSNYSCNAVNELQLCLLRQLL